MGSCRSSAVLDPAAYNLDTREACSLTVLCWLQTWTQATTYLQLVGIVLGQLTFGFLGDGIGFHRAMLIDMSLILMGVVMLILSTAGAVQTWTQATTYLQLVGIVLGQLTFGFLGDGIGRQRAMLIDMSLILIGVIMLTLSNGTTIQVCLFASDT